MKESIVVGILQNSAILLSFALLYDYIWVKDKTRQTIGNKLITGLIIGGIGILLMLTPWTLVPGLVFDTRSIMLAITGIFFGPIPTIIAMVITAAYRVLMGGDGMTMGIAVIATSGTIGILWNVFRRKSRRYIRLRDLYLLGIVVHLLMLLCVFLLPSNMQLNTFKNIALTVLIIYPFATVLLGYLMVNRIHHWDIKGALSKSEERFKSLFDRAPVGYQSLDANGNFLEVNETWLDLLGYSKEEVIGKWFGDFLAPKYVEPFRKRFPMFKELGKIHSEFEMVKKDGTIIVSSFEGLIGYTVAHEFKQTHCVLTDITERKKAENAIMESEERYRNLFEGAHDAILIMDKEKFTNCNEMAVEIFGYTQNDDIANHYPWEFSPEYQPDGALSLEKAKVFIQSALEDKPQRFEWVHKKKDGTLFDADVSLNLIKLGDNNFLQSIVRDITAQKLAIKALEESEEKYRRITENAQDIIFRYDLIPYMRLTYINKAVANITGYTPEECVSDPQLMFSLIHPDDQPIMQQYVETLQSPQEPFTLRWIDKTGSFHWMETRAVPIYDADGIMIAVEGITRDVTNEMKSRAAIKESEEKYRLLHEHAGVGIGYYSPDGLVLSFNELAAKNMGGKQEDFVGKSIYDMFSKEEADFFMNRIRLSANSDEKFDYEDLLALPTGNFWFSSVFTRIKDIDGNVVGVQIISQNITARKEAEQKLEHKINELERFNDITVNRELKMVELKEEINALHKRLGENEKYKIVK